jgi:ribonuclease Z
MIDLAKNKEKGIDVWVHEMVMPPDAWARKLQGEEPGAWFLQYITDVQNSSHTTQGAFGYLLTQIEPRPRLTVATHFQAQDDTIESARTSLDAYGIPRTAYTFASDFTVLNVTEQQIKERRLEVSRFAFAAPAEIAPQPYTDPKYNKPNPQDPAKVVGDPYGQIAEINAKYGIEPGCDTFTKDGYWPGYR